MVANPRSRMNKFVMGVPSLMEKECHTAMLLNDMDISRLMVHAQQIEESKIREITQEGKRPRAPNQHYQVGGHSYGRARCPTCGKQHGGKCLAGTDGCFACGHKGHKRRDCQNLKSRGKDVNKASLDPNAPKKNTSYGMGARKDN
ncbi:uncharacterized protein [Solanum lycopersicum]|uniref:uncharacterized protein n=1 Tax=Solanum lycopersicum TaxID=4081 RepID=UPI00374A92BF